MKSAKLRAGRRLSNRSRTLGMALLAMVALTLYSAPSAAQAGKAAKEAPAAKWETVDLKKFDRSTVIDNKWMPLKPGMRYSYVGTTVEDDGKVMPHRFVMYVTDLVKEIAGVRTLVTYDLDYKDKDLEEAEIAFFAQDNDGNVWRFGEYPEEYEDGKFSKAPTWIHGIAGARAGIAMKANPKAGDPSYAQGWGPGVGWTDRGQPYKMGETTTVKAGKYTDVLIIKETSSEEGPDAWQLKYYAPGVGNVRVGWGGSKEKTKEVLELIKIEQVSPKEMAVLRQKALELEKSAFKRSKDVYAKTKPMELLKP